VTLGATQSFYHGIEMSIDLIYHGAKNLYQIAKVILTEYYMLA